MCSILTVRHLNKIFELTKDNHQHVLKNVDLEVQKGEFVSIMGASGSGKSTLLYTISGMDKITEGEVFLDNREIHKSNEKELAKLRLNRMGFIFQQSHLLKDLNILENIVLPSLTNKNSNKKEIFRKGYNLLKTMGIETIANNRISEASGGQLQRATICRALMNDPVIIFGDEPTGALNSKAADEVMDVLSEINKLGTTIMLVTHDIKVAAKTERVLFMEDGRIISEKSIGKYNESCSLNEREKIIFECANEIGL